MKEEGPILGVALGCSSPQELLLHEFCHSLQWAEDSRFWTENALSSIECESLALPSGSEAVDALDAWTEGTLELSLEQVESFTIRAQGVELDCERRTVALGPSLIPGFDGRIYSRRASAYVRLYRVVMEGRRWGILGHPSYDDPGFLAIMPDDLHSMDYSAPLSAAEKRSFRDYLVRHMPESRIPKFDLTLDW